MRVLAGNCPDTGRGRSDCFTNFNRMDTEVLLSLFRPKLFKIIAVLALAGLGVAWYALSEVRDGARLERNIRMLKDLSEVDPARLVEPALQAVYRRLAVSLEEETAEKPGPFSGIFQRAAHGEGGKEFAGKFLAGAAFFLLLYFLQSAVRIFNIVEKKTFRWWYFFRKDDFYSLALCIVPGAANAAIPMFAYPVANYLLFPSALTLLTLLVDACYREARRKQTR